MSKIKNFETRQEFERAFLPDMEAGGAGRDGQSLL